MDVFLLILIGAVAMFLVKSLNGVTFRPGANSDDDDSSSSVFDDDSHSVCTSSPHRMFEDEDSPARGLWDPTSMYYDHSDHHISFDDHHHHHTFDD